MKILKALFKQRIYIFGDSHVSVWQNKNSVLNDKAVIKCDVINKELIITKTGPDLAYNLINKKLIIDKIKTIKKGEFIIFSYGEIDCRVYLPIKNNVKDCVERYLNFIKAFSNDYKICIVAPFPSTNVDYSDEQFPTHGTNQERNLITKEFTNLLIENSEKYNYRVISIYDELTQDNITNMDYYMDQIHLSKKAYPLLINKIIPLV